VKKQGCFQAFAAFLLAAGYRQGIAR